MEISRLTGDGVCSPCTESQNRDADGAESFGHCHYHVLKDLKTC